MHFQKLNNLFSHSIFSRLLFFIIIVGFIFTPLDVSARYRVSCRSVILSNSTKVKRLYDKSANLHVLPASTTKVMTALLAMEKLSLDSYVTVSNKASYPQPSKLYLNPGTQYKVRDLMYAIVLSSANDASVVLAEAVGGSEYNFVQMMNRRAKQLGAKQTRFANSHGLPTKKGTQYTTAYDMYLIFREAMKYPFFREAIRYNYKTIYSKGGRKHFLKSHNKMLFLGWKKKVYGKTGYTRSAGACFVGTVQKGNDQLIIAVFGCDRRWDDIKHVVTRYGGINL